MGNTTPPRMLYNDYGDARLGASVLACQATADPLYPFANVINRDRHVIAALLSPPNPCNLDIALATNYDIYGVGFCNLFPVSGTALVQAGVDVYAASNAAFTQDLQLVQSVSQFGFIGASSASSPKTYGVLFTGAYNSKYWRFQFKGWPSFYAGRLALFGAAYDMPAAGKGARAGSSYALVTPRNRGRALGGGPIIEDIGAQRQRFTLRFRGTDEDIRNQVEQLAQQRRPWMHTDHDAQWFHVEMTETGDEQEFEQVGVGCPNVWETTVETKQLAP